MSLSSAMPPSVDDEELARVVRARRPSSHVGEQAAGLDMPEDGGAVEGGLGPRTNVNLPMESGILPCSIHKSHRSTLQLSAARW